MDMLHEQQDLQTPSCRAQYQAGGDEADPKMLTRQHQGMDGDASRQDPETSRRQRRLEKDHQNICGAPTAPQRLRATDADTDADLYIFFFVHLVTLCLFYVFSVGCLVWYCGDDY